MTTSDYIVCEILGCGEYDIHTLFDTLTDNDYFSNAVTDCKESGIELSAGAIWVSAVYSAFRDVFGYEVEPEIYFNFIDSHVSLNRESAENIENFSDKASKFQEITSFEIEFC